MLLASSVSGLFKWRQFEPGVILLAVGWYLRFSLSYRDVEELLAERGLHAGIDLGTTNSFTSAASVIRLVCLELKPNSYDYRTQLPSIPRFSERHFAFKRRTNRVPICSAI